MLKRWDTWLGCAFSVAGAALLAWTASGSGPRPALGRAAAADLIGGTGMKDCVPHAWLRCDYDPCEYAGEEVSCSMCVNDPTAREDCETPDSNEEPCSCTANYHCPGLLKEGVCINKVCAVTSETANCTRMMGQCVDP